MIDLGIQNKVAVISGSTRGIGKAIARLLGEAGAIVFVNGKDEKAVEAAVSEFTARNIRAFGVAGDVSDETFVKEFVGKIIGQFGRIDILVNNAGIYDHHFIEEITTDEWQRFIDVNLKSAFMFSRETVPYMKKNKFGRIVNIASVVGLSGRARGAHYNAAKGGMIAFTQGLARELGSFGITVNAVAPAHISTDKSVDVAREKNFDLEKLRESVPLRRLGRPEDVAKVVLFLASDLASFITGETLVVSGGQFIL